jgi:hypothetical protein
MFTIDEGKLFFGAAINYNDLCWIYPLKMKEIIGMGQDEYSEHLSIVCADIGEIQREMKKANIPEEEICSSILEYFSLRCFADSTFLVKLQEAFFTFIREKIHFLPEEQIFIIGEDFSSKRFLDKNNFSEFQNVIRAQNYLPVPEKIPENESPMARKFRLRREQVKEVKRKQAIRDGETISLINSMATLICFNIGITFENVGNLTIYQFKELLARAQAKYKYDLDIRMIAAGADPKKIKPKHWFGKLD